MMRPASTLVAVCMVLELALSAPAAARKVHREPCSGGSFIVQDKTLLAVGDAPVLERIVLGQTDAIITSGCTVAAPLTLKSGKVRATWPECNGLTGPVSLKAKITGSSCDVLKGVLVTKKSKPKKRKFRATRLSSVTAPDGISFGAEGGTFVNPDGTSVTVPPGAYTLGETGKVAVVGVPLADVTGAIAAYGLALPDDAEPIAAAQVTLGANDPNDPGSTPTPGLALTVGMPEPAGVEDADALLHVLVEPTLAAGATDARPPQLVFDGEVTRAGGQLTMQLSSHNLSDGSAESPAAIRPRIDRLLVLAGISLTIRKPRGSFCLVEGIVVAGPEQADSHRPLGGIIVNGLFGGRTTPEGFYRTAVARGSQTLTVIEKGKMVGTATVQCDPSTMPVVTQDILIEEQLTSGPELAIDDPEGYVKLDEGTTSYNVLGRANVPSIQLTVHNVVSADPGFRNTVPVLSGSWAQTVILGPGINTVIATAGQGASRRQAYRVIEIPGDPGGLKFTLTWTTDGTDIDLHVVTPKQSEIYYANTEADGGSLDVDDTNGRGPENVTFATAESGTYRVSAVYYSGSVPTPVTILVIINGRLVAAFNSTLSSTGNSFSPGTVTMPQGTLGR